MTEQTLTPTLQRYGQQLDNDGRREKQIVIPQK